MGLLCIIFCVLRPIFYVLLLWLLLCFGVWVVAGAVGFGLWFRVGFLGVVLGVVFGVSRWFSGVDFGVSGFHGNLLTDRG